ncbi:wd-40 repeat protein [Stylonychia lemnae]|uniref:Wd-40 repeat protein n=1 Tax=Stylonychia lemnae TaxID=5949 RepID=A0A078BAV8_STYLE|nr:wd-40 repeat protein [Stylonychia lemnae]|eukprot:CDW90703.1 wd-40 repeat protein [Stylonychia lemnae]
MLEKKQTLSEKLLSPDQHFTVAKEYSQIEINQNKEIYPNYINLNDVNVCEEGVIQSNYDKLPHYASAYLVQNNSQILINGVTDPGTGQVGYAQLRDLNTYQEVQMKILDVEHHDLQGQNIGRQLIQFNVSPCKEFLLYSIQQTRKQKYALQICIHKIDDFFAGKPPSVKIIKEGENGLFKNVIFGPKDNILFSQQQNAYGVEKNAIKSCVIFKCNYKDNQNKETQIFDIQDWWKNVPKREVGSDKPMTYISPDGVFRCLIGYPDFELSNYFYDNCLFATYLKETRTLIFEEDSLKVKKDIDHVIYFSPETEYLGYDSKFNLFQIINSYGMTTMKIGELKTPEGYKFQSSKPILLQNSIIMNAKHQTRNTGAVLVYDKLRFNLINQYEMKEFYKESQNFIFYDKGVLKYLSNESKKFLHLNLYNSRFYKEDDLVFQQTNYFKTENNIIAYRWDNQHIVYDLEQKMKLVTLPSQLHYEMSLFLKLGTSFYLIGTNRKDLFLIQQDDTSIYHQLTIDGGKFNADNIQIISISNSDIRLIGLSSDNFIQVLNINLKEFTAQIEKLNYFEGIIKKFKYNEPLQAFKNDQTGQILIIISANQILYAYDFHQKQHRQVEIDDKLINITISWNDNAIFGLVDNKKSVKAYDLQTLESFPKLSYISKDDIQRITMAKDYLLLYLSGDGLFELLEIKNNSFTQKRIRTLIIPEETLKHFPRNTQIIRSQYDGSLQYFKLSTEDQGTYQLNTWIQKCDPLKTNQTSNCCNLDYPLLQLDHLPNAKYVLINKNNGMSFYHDQRDKRIGYVSSYFNTDEVVKIKESKLKNNDTLLTELINIDPYLKFYPGIGNILNQMALRPIILEFISKKLSLMDKSETPIILMKSEINGKSPIDIACEKNQLKSIGILLELLTKYQNDHGFNYLIDQRLVYFIKKGLDLTEYFDSFLPKLTIISENYPTEHQDEDEYILGVNDLPRPSDINEKYDEIFGQVLVNSTSDGLASIEYFLINLPDTLTKNPKNLMIALSESENIEYFENLTIQTIIKFKWNQYTKNYFQNQFFIFLVFVVSFVLEIYQSISFGKTQALPTEEERLQGIEFYPDTRNLVIMIINKTICSSVLLYFFYYEVRQASKQVGYFKELWNLFDFSLIASYTILNIVEYTTGDKNAIIIMDIVVVLLSFLKVNFFLRIYDGFSFLVSMMSSVFKDIQYFILFFLVFIFQFGLIFVILFSAQRIEEYDGIGTVGYFLMIFRISSGDFAVDNFKDQGSTFLVGLSWTIWVIAVLILNIVFMNFIIAVISESYEKVMQKLVAESYKVKANMIVERELLLNPNDEEERRFYFPQYMILRRPIETSDGDSGEWQGFIKDLKYTIRTSAQKSKTEVIQNVIPIQNKIEILGKNSASQQETMICVQTQIELLQKQILDQNSKIDTLINKQNLPAIGKDDIVNLNQKVETLSLKMEGYDKSLEQISANILKLLEK